MCDRALLAHLRDAHRSRNSAAQAVLTDAEIKGLLARRDKIVQFFDQLVKRERRSGGPVRPAGALAVLL